MIYSSSKEVQLLKRKLEQVAQFGCNAFAILFDDIEPELSETDKEVFKSFAEGLVRASELKLLTSNNELFAKRTSSLRQKLFALISFKNLPALDTFRLPTRSTRRSIGRSSCSVRPSTVLPGRYRT